MSKIKCKGQFLPKRMIGTEKLKTFGEYYKDRKNQESCIYKTEQKTLFLIIKPLQSILIGASHFTQEKAQLTDIWEFSGILMFIYLFTLSPLL